MKKNKKALMGMLVAMVLSMGAMGGYNSNVESVSTQQVAVSCASVAGSSEGAKAGAFGVAAAAAGYGAEHFYSGAIIAGATGAGAPVAVAGALLGTICTL